MAHTQGRLTPTELLVGGGGFVFATFFLSPDLDLGHSWPSRRWKLLAPLWGPYRLLFRHRGLSHNALMGSLTRLGYLAAVSVLVLVLLAFLPQLQAGRTPAQAWTATHGPLWARISLIVAVVKANAPLALSLLAGIWVSDLVHIAADRLVSLARSRRIRR